MAKIVSDPVENRTLHFEGFDTKRYHPSAAFKMYRSFCAEAPFPSSLEYDSEAPFQAKEEAARIRDGWIFWCQSTPHVIVRTAAHTAHAYGDFIITYHLSGGVGVEQGKRTILAEPGDVVITDTARPFRIVMSPHAVHHVVGISVPRAYFSSMVESQPEFDGIAILRKKTPLANCLELLAQHIVSASRDGLTCIYDACFSLLPLELDFDRDDPAHKRTATGSQHLLREILFEIDRDIANSEMSPTHIAAKFGISVRYVHKLFLAMGVTFQSYVMERRLEGIRRELIKRSGPFEPIYSLAYRWGFSELGTFNRAFKRRFGCTPRSFRRD